MTATEREVRRTATTAKLAKLSGFKRTTVRQYCAVRGIDL